MSNGIIIINKLKRHEAAPSNYGDVRSFIINARNYDHHSIDSHGLIRVMLKGHNQHLSMVTYYPGDTITKTGGKLNVQA